MCSDHSHLNRTDSTNYGVYGPSTVRLPITNPHHGEQRPVEILVQLLRALMRGVADAREVLLDLHFDDADDRNGEKARHEPHPQVVLEHPLALNSYGY